MKNRLIFCFCIFGILFAALNISAQTVDLPDLIFQPEPMTGTDSELRVALGDTAPDFELPSISGETIRLSDYRGAKNVVLSFVPAAWTPVCSSQWPGYNLALDYFEEEDAVILGITVDNLPTLHAWTTAMGVIDFPVLSDFYPHGQVAQCYGVLRNSGVSERALFLIDKQGIIRFIDVHNINERPPLEELVNALRAL
jgi:peroxiredoxin (alkyl hydroperoxide reductase subunit C)